MTKHPLSGRMWESRAALCLRSVGLCTLLVMSLMALPASAMRHPVKLAEERARRGSSKRVVAESAPKRRGAAVEKKQKASGRKSAAAATRAGSHAAKPSAKSRRSRRQEQPDNDPPVMHRVRGKRGGAVEKLETSRRGRGLRGVAKREVVRREVAAAKPERSAIKKSVVAEAFARAASGDMRARSSALASVAPAAVLPESVENGLGLANTLPQAALPQASANLVADAAESPLPLRPRIRGKVNAMPDDRAGREAVIEQAMTPVVLPAMYMRRGRLAMPAPLKGSRDILVHQNTMADSEGLDRIRDDDDLNRMQAMHLLVPIRSSSTLAVNEDLPENRRYARPWAARFAVDMSRAFYAQFHQSLRLNSAVRTIEYQLRLQRVNGNAAAVDGDGASPHLTGQALDFGKRGMSKQELAWMRAYLGILMRAGKVDVEEEFQQACFHVSVYHSYLASAPKTKLEVAQAKPDVRTY